MSDQKRPGAPRISEQGTETRCLTISKEDIAYLLTIDPSLSKAVRSVIDHHRKEHSNATDHHRNT